MAADRRKQFMYRGVTVVPDGGPGKRCLGSRTWYWRVALDYGPWRAVATKADARWLIDLYWTSPGGVARAKAKAAVDAATGPSKVGNSAQ